VWSERTPEDHVVFRSETSVKTFANDQPFEERRLEGTIPRRWI
jgi:hypothetical protein